MQHVGRNALGGGFALGERARDFAAYAADFALEVAQASLARVAADDFGHRVRGELDLDVAQTVFGNLLGHQMAFGDLELLFFGVARQFQHFHPVAQRRRNRIEHVGRGQEQHLGEIEGNIEIMIDEGVVLLGVEYLE